MRKSHKLVVAAVAAAAGIAAIGASSAFTNSNDVSAITYNYAGYGKVTSSGVTLTGLHYSIASDASKVDGVTFDVTEDLSSASVTAILTLDTPDTTHYTCDATVAQVITCDLSGAPVDITTITQTGLTVTNA